MTEVWHRLGCFVPDNLAVWSIAPPVATGSAVWELCPAAILWHLWKARNDVVFNHHACSASDVLRRAVEDIATWSHRLRADYRECAVALRGVLLLHAHV